MPSRKTYRLNRRLGLYGAAGGRRPTTNEVILKSKCPGTLTVTGTTAGNSCSFQLNNYNDPMGTGGTFTGTTNFHPENHEELLSLGYDRLLVLSATYRFDVAFRGTGQSGVDDFVVCYWFTRDADSYTFTAGTVTTDFWRNIRANPGIFWRVMSGNHSGGSVYPSAAPIVVNVPSVVKISKRLNQSSTGDAITWQDFTTTLADNTDGPTTHSAYLNFAVFNRYGASLTASDIQVDVTITQSTKFWKDQDAADMPVILDTHA